MGRGIIDLTGKRYGRLVVTSYYRKKSNRPYWNVLCDCGNSDTSRGDWLVQGRKKSCGCLSGKNVLTTLSAKEVGRNEKTLYLLLSLAFREGNSSLTKIIIDTLNGDDLDEKYEREIEEGFKIFKWQKMN